MADVEFDARITDLEEGGGGSSNSNGTKVFSFLLKC